MNRKLRFVILSLLLCGENIKKQEYMKSCFEKLNLLGIIVDKKEQEKTINNISQMPEDILNDLENSKIIGLILDNIGLPLENKDNKYKLSIYSFDMEVFDTSTMYTEFLNNINLLTNNELKIKVIKEDTSNVNYEEGTGIQIIEFKILDKEYKFEAKVNYDWFDINIISYINKIIEVNGLNKYLYITNDGWQNCIVFYNTNEWARKYNNFFPELQIKKYN